MCVVEDRFSQTFSTWGIRLPPEDVAARRRGKIMKADWSIWYLFAADETGDYPDDYAPHRMMGNEHVRIHSDGLAESLPTISSFRIFSDDLKEHKKLEAAYRFGLSGSEPGRVRINRILHLED